MDKTPRIHHFRVVFVCVCLREREFVPTLLTGIKEIPDNIYIYKYKI